MMAPDFSDRLEWVNCDPLTMRELRGRVVMLAFWSAGSALGHNLLNDVVQIQARHSDSVTAIAVHTPKFDAERSSRLALKACNRLGLRIPVAHDPDFELWQRCQVRAWPTLVLIDTDGHIADSFVGDLHREAIDNSVRAILERAGAGGRVFEHTLPTVRAEPRLPLAFPGGLAVGPTHLYVADSSHHRVLECSHDGRVMRQFGSGNPGFLDGSIIESGFFSPRGLCLTRDLLYVADTGNHALRRIRLMDGEVDTIAGSGRPGLIAGTVSGAPNTLPLDAPWALAGSNDRMYIAMAGASQVWEYDLTKRAMRVLVGAGSIGLSDGQGEKALMAQPAALALIQQTLYVADSAASAIRGVHLVTGQAHTLIGQGLYEFGDQDGARHTALLQHPLGLTLDARSPLLWIADSYNCQIKSLRLGGGELRRYELGYRLHEPAALACSTGVLWIANTNAHEVLRVDLESAQVRRLPIGE